MGNMKTGWNRIIGLDLTDPLSRARRPIALAEIQRRGGGGRPRIRVGDPIKWPHFDGGCMPEAASQIVKLAGVPPEGRALLVIDGPQALAAQGGRVRGCEREARTPGRTPDHEPSMGMPFAGYIRGSIQLFAALLQDDRWQLLASGRDRNATLLEVFPGDAWRRLSTQRLAAKTALLGRRQRLDLLQAHFHLEAPRPPSHDDLDAAMCTALGYWWTQGATLQLGQAPVFDGCWREGFNITPAPRVRRRAAPEAGPRTWGYRATGAIADRGQTFELAHEHNVLVRNVFNAARRAIPHVRAIRPGDRVFILHSDQGQNDWLQAIVDRPGPKVPPIPGHEAEFPAFGVIEDPELVAHVEQLGYQRDPELRVCTALPLTDVERCGDPPVEVPGGRNTVWPIA
jgi:hypothetical protein